MIEGLLFLALSIFAACMWPRLTMFCLALLFLVAIPIVMAFIPVIGLFLGVPLTALVALFGGFTLYYGLPA